MRFLDRLRRPAVPRTPQDADRLALRHLAERGADLSRPRHVLHFLYFATEHGARAAAASVEEVAWDVTVHPPDARIAEWTVRAEGYRVVSADTVAAFRAALERVAADHHGEYDGWEAAAEP